MEEKQNRFLCPDANLVFEKNTTMVIDAQAIQHNMEAIRRMTQNGSSSLLKKMGMALACSVLMRSCMRSTWIFLL